MDGAHAFGWNIIGGTIEVAFTAGRRFTNRAGTIQGGILAAILDERDGGPCSSGLLSWTFDAERRRDA